MTNVLKGLAAARAMAKQEVRDVQYAIIYANGKLDGLGGDPEVLSQLLRKGDQLVRRTVGPWEVIETWDGR